MTKDLHPDFAELPANMPPEILAEWLGIDTQRLAVLRVNGSGPAFFKVGRRVRYLRSDVVDWVMSTRATRTPWE